MSSSDWKRIISRVAIWTLVGAVVGAMAGFMLGTLAPELYVGWFSQETVDRTGAPMLGVSLGFPQGAGVGVLVGLGTVALPWLRGAAAVRAGVSCEFDASSGTVSLKGRTRTPVLVLGVWAPYELEAVALFERPVMVTDEGSEVSVRSWCRSPPGHCLAVGREG